MISFGDVISLIETGGKLRDWHNRLQQKFVDDFVMQTVNSRSMRGIYEYLYKIYYDLNILMGPDGPFPVAVLPLTQAAQDEPERLSVKLGTRSSPIFVFHPEIVDALHRIGSNVWNGNTFSLLSINCDPSNYVDGLSACISNYFGMVSSADYLEYELIAGITRSDDILPLEELSARFKVINSYPTPSECLFSGGGVDAALAISTLVVYAREGRYWLLCDVRSKSVAEYSDLYHVIPSFIYQPVVAPTKYNLQVEKSIQHNIFREYLEEIFNLPEVQHAGKKIAPDYFYDHPNLLLLKRLMKEGKADIKGTGLVFNLLNHRPEICTLLLIKDEEWFYKQSSDSKARSAGLNPLTLNDEFMQSTSSNKEKHLDIITTLPIDDPTWKTIVKPWLMVPPAAPALILGVKTAVKNLGINQPEWINEYYVEQARTNF